MMNVVKAGSQYQIYGEDLETYDRLPVRSYDVVFHKMMGFYLTSRPNLEANESKIYGDHLRKVDKVINSYHNSNRNFGVILSGQKGIGKSLFARLLAEKAIQNNLPVITVTDYIPGIAGFLASIEQEVVVIFDEFEKTFSQIPEQKDPQEEMLSLFDGLDGGKKLFVITCNEVRKLNDYFVDRPGRFHYHFRMGNPSDVEITEYMKDKLEEKYHFNIPRIINFARTANMTYDYLRAIAFDLNQGYELEECLNDLNVSSVTNADFDVYLIMEDGSIYINMNDRINLCQGDLHWLWVRKQGAYGADREDIQIGFSPSDVVFENNELIIPLDKVNINRDSSDDYGLEKDEIKEANERFNNRKPVKIKLERCPVYGKAERFFV